MGIYTAYDLSRNTADFNVAHGWSLRFTEHELNRFNRTPGQDSKVTWRQALLGSHVSARRSP
ncbi:hypothetical protein PSCICE_50850 [Pseudomonas cichorii]|nr:hypothetical protein PSCICE_50850 [Pseudomonas cichorii]